MITVLRPQPAATLHHPVFRSLLCPVDFSAPSAVALRFAAALVQRWSGALTVTHAVERMQGLASDFERQELVERATTEVSDFANQTLAIGFSQPHAFAPMAQVGRAADVILRTAKVCHAELIVMATQE